MNDTTVIRRRASALTIATRIPATLISVGVLVLAGVISGALWHPFARNPAWSLFAYGLPALQEGRWWTPLTGALFVAFPAIYVPMILAFAGMAYLEYRRGWRVATAYFLIGQLVSVLGTALLVWLASMTPWLWAQTEALLLDVGPSGGTMACIAAAIGLFSSPWRSRAWLILLAFVLVSMLFWASIAHVEHLVAVLAVLLWDRSLRIAHTAVHEQRFIAFLLIATIGVIEAIALVTPTNGPFGPTAPVSGSLLDVSTDIIVSALVAHHLDRGRRWAWLIAVCLAGLNVVGAVGIVALLTVRDAADVARLVGGEPALTLAISFLWLLMLVYLIAVRRAFRAHRRSVVGLSPEPSHDEVVRVLHAAGGGTLSWMTTWEGNSYARTTHGIVAFQRRAGVALALADPLGPPQTRAESVREFIDGADHAGLVPCFFSASEATRDAVPPGWRSAVVAEDMIVDLPGLAFTGKRWNSVRTSMNRAAREGIEFRLTRMKDESWGVRQQLQAISAMWVADKNLPEMGFTLGTLTEATDPEVRIAIALAPNGDVDGFLSWLPVLSPQGVQGWTLDLMRRRENGFGPVMEYLIGASALRFSEEGAQTMSLSGAPLAYDYPAGGSILTQLGERLSDSLETVYGFRSLRRFKEKFQPRYETMYLLYRDESDLTRIAMALTRAMLPTATLSQLAKAGLGIVRGGS